MPPATRRASPALIGAGNRESVMSRKTELAKYEIRSGPDGTRGIYLRAYNVRLAKFNANSTTLQRALASVFEQAAREPKAKRLARLSGRPVDMMIAATGGRR